MKKSIYIILCSFPLWGFGQQDSSIIKALKQLSSTNNKTYEDLKKEVDNVDKDFKDGQINNDVKTKMIRELEKHQKVNNNLGKEISSMSSDGETLNVPIEQLVGVINKVDSFVKVVKLDIGIIQETRQINKKGVFEMKKTFMPGEYTITNQSKSQVRSIYMELCKRVLDFAAKNSNIKQIADIEVIGYSDAQEIRLNSTLEKELNQFRSIKVTSSSELNQILSEQRAKSIVNYLEELFNEMKTDALRKNLNIVLNFIGKGESLPDMTKSYNTDDERRRIVEVRWIVLPDKFLKD